MQHLRVTGNRQGTLTFHVYWPVDVRVCPISRRGNVKVAGNHAAAIQPRALSTRHCAAAGTATPTRWLARAVRRADGADRANGVDVPPLTLIFIQRLDIYVHLR